MKIGIVTVYESVTNLGSYLQAYALKLVLENMGHDVYVIEKTSIWNSIKQCVGKLNPKREFFLRFLKAGKFISAMGKLNLIPMNRIEEMELDCLIYGSDEIWNLENSYFRHDLFWGKTNPEVPKIAYAVSVGTMTDETFAKYKEYANSVRNFKCILVRDIRTKNVIGNIVQKELPCVCDPTFLLPISRMSEKIQLPKKKYLLVYTYGVDPHIEKLVREFAEKNNLMIVSVCFWHFWVDKVIECSPLQFSSLIAGAEYVFTTTFHGAVFTMLNHKRCCILPIREKVRDIVERLNMQKYLISNDCTMEEFVNTINKEFDVADFEMRVNEFRAISMDYLRGALKCLEE